MSDIYKEFSLRLKIWIEFQKETKLPMSKSSDKSKMSFENRDPVDDLIFDPNPKAVTRT